MNVYVRNQIDCLAATSVASILISFALCIYCIGFIALEQYGVVFLLLFSASWIILFFILNEIVFRKLFNTQISPVKKAILITGCDQGFGFEFAKRLSNAGFQVFAGCLQPFQDGGLVLSHQKGTHCFKMDVTKPEDINLALDYITSHLQENELWAIVNNAGINKGSEIETTTMQKIQDVLDVNLLGAIQVTKTFLPLLKTSKGRIVNIASAAGRLTLPGFVPYSMSKNALIVFSDGLRLEMKKHQVKVITVEPFTYRTKLSNLEGISKQIDENWRSSSDGVKSIYSKDDVASARETAKALFNWGVSDNLDEVSAVIEEAVLLSCPPYRYSPGKWYSNLGMWFLYFIPKPIADFVFGYFVLGWR